MDWAGVLKTLGGGVPLHDLRFTSDYAWVSLGDFAVALAKKGHPPLNTEEDVPTTTVEVAGTKKRPGRPVRALDMTGVVAYALLRCEETARMAAFQLLHAANGDMGVALTLATGTAFRFEFCGVGYDQTGSVRWEDGRPPDIEFNQMVIERHVTSSHCSRSGEEGLEPVGKAHTCLAVAISRMGWKERCVAAGFLLRLLAGESLDDHVKTAFDRKDAATLTPWRTTDKAAW